VYMRMSALADLPASIWRDRRRKGRAKCGKGAGRRAVRSVVPHPFQRPRQPPPTTVLVCGDAGEGWIWGRKRKVRGGIMSFNKRTHLPTPPTHLRCAREAQGEVARGARKRGSGSVMQASAHSCRGCVTRARKSRGSALPVVPASDLVDEEDKTKNKSPCINNDWRGLDSPLAAVASAPPTPWLLLVLASSPSSLPRSCSCSLPILAMDAADSRSFSGQNDGPRFLLLLVLLPFLLGCCCC
jgi:hypothetical protein